MVMAFAALGDGVEDVDPVVPVPVPVVEVLLMDGMATM